eukprot:1158589-Pelagomonas_calceolata.AAC.3
MLPFFACVAAGAGVPGGPEVLGGAHAGRQPLQRAPTLQGPHHRGPPMGLRVLDTFAERVCLTAAAAYEAHVIASLPGLRVLDTFEVEHYEGAAAIELLEQEDSYLAMMLHNACMVHKMVRSPKACVLVVHALEGSMSASCCHAAAQHWFRAWMCCALKWLVPVVHTFEGNMSAPCCHATDQYPCVH